MLVHTLSPSICFILELQVNEHSHRSLKFNENKWFENKWKFKAKNTRCSYVTVNISYLFILVYIVTQFRKK